MVYEHFWGLLLIQVIHLLFKLGSGVMPAFEIAFDKDRHNLWLECDFRLIVLVAKDLCIIP